MASAYGILRDFGTYITPYNFDLIQQGLAYKQQKFDANAAKIQSLVDSAAHLKLARGVDQEYLSTRLNGLLDQVNKLGAVDLSKNNVERQVSGYIGKVYDDKVMAAYQGTQNLAKLQSEISHFKKNKPKQYSARNHAYALQGAERWLAGTEAGEEYSGGSYTPYTDTRGKLNKIMRDLVKTKGEQIMKVPVRDAAGNPTGYMVEKRVKELDAQEIRTVATNMLDGNDLSQLEIDGWYNYGRRDPKEVEAVFDNYGTRMKAELEAIQASLAYKASKAKGADKLKYSQEAAAYGQRLVNLENTLESAKGDPNSMGTFLERERLLGGLVATHQFRESSELYSTDEPYWKKLNYDYKLFNDDRRFKLDNAKHRQSVLESNRSHDLAMRKQALAEDKYNLDLYEAGLGGSTSGVAGGLPLGFAPVGVSSETTTKEKEKAETDLYNSITADRVSGDQHAARIIAGLSTEEKAVYDAFKAVQKFVGKDDTEIMHSYIRGQNKGDTEYNKIKAKEAAQIKSWNEARKAAVPSVDVWGEKVFNVMSEGGDALVGNNFGVRKTYQDSQGNIVTANSYKDYLEKEHGITSYAQLQAKPEVFREFQKDVTGDLFLSSFTSASSRTIGRGLPDDLSDFNMDFSKADMSARGFENLFASYAKSGGYDVSFRDVFDVNDDKWYRGSLLAGQRVTVKKGLKGDAKKAFDFINNKLKQKEFDYFSNRSRGYLYGKGDSWEDFGAVRQYLGADAIYNNYLNEVEKRSPAVGRNIENTFTKGTRGYNNVRGLADKYVRGIPKDTAITISPTKDRGGWELKIPSKKEGEGFQVFPVTNEELDKFGVTATLNIADTKGLSASQYEGIPFPSPNMTFFGEGDTRAFKKALKPRNLNASTGRYMSKEGFKSQVLADAGVGTKKLKDKYTPIIDRVLASPSKFRSNVNSDGEAWYTTLSNSEGDVIYDLPLGLDITDEVLTQHMNTPEFTLGRSLSLAIVHAERGDTEVLQRIIETLGEDK